MGTWTAKCNVGCTLSQKKMCESWQNSSVHKLVNSTMSIFTGFDNSTMVMQMLTFEGK